LILVLVLYFCLMEEEKRRKEKKASLWRRRVSPGLDLTCWLCRSQLLGAIKGWSVGQSLNFFLHLIWWEL
jgi:hypothetical protein